MLSLLLKGFVIGFAIAAPVGPIGVLCIQRSLHHGAKLGIITGWGAALADGIYGLIAGFGLSTLSNLLLQEQHSIRIIGGIFLLLLGAKLFYQAPTAAVGSKKPVSGFQAFTTTFLLNLTNPVTILSFLAVFAGLGLGTAHGSLLDATWLVLGIILGSAAWWLVLCCGVAYFIRRRLTKSLLNIINKSSAAIIFLFGVAALLYR